MNDQDAEQQRNNGDVTSDKDTTKRQAADKPNEATKHVDDPRPGRPSLPAEGPDDPEYTGG